MEKLKKPMLIACGGFVILFIFMFIISSCNRKVYTAKEFEEFLLAEAKTFYKNNVDTLPQENGKTTLSISNIIDNQKEYIGSDLTCDGGIDVINNNGYYLYVSNVKCSDGYSSRNLSEHLINSDVVSSGNGLYSYNDYYIYRGDNVNNYVIFNNQLWRIVKINSNGTLRMIETDYMIKTKNDEMVFKNNKRSSSKWDDRYNVDKENSSGYNDYIHDGINSRIKDYLEEVYKNEYSDEIKSYIVKQDLCIGKRSFTDSINDGSIECSNVLSEQNLGLLQLNEYINASLDPGCVNAESATCLNYNYLTEFNTTFWTMTAVSENSYEVYKIGSMITKATAKSNAVPKIVINLSREARFTTGDGTEENPYIIN